MGALLFFDIDGTLLTLDESHVFPEGTKKALLQAKENGHKIFINTGRVKSAIDKKLKAFPFDGMVCGCGTYIEYEGRELFHQQLEKERCVAIAAKLHSLGYETVFEGAKQMFVDGEHKQGAFLQFVDNYFAKNSELPVGHYTDETLIFDKFTTYEKEGCDKKGFEEFSKEFHLIPHGHSVIEAVPDGFTKATGIQFLIEYLGASLSDCYSFGDSINDMEMLQFVSHSVGMGNAVEEVKAVVEYVTEDVQKDGICQALKYYNLI